MSPAISWWLVPSEASAKPIKTAIDKSAKQHNSPQFDPHVTLFTLPSTSSTTEQLIKTTKSVLTGASAVTLTPGTVQVGDNYHQSVFLTLQPTEALTSLRTKLAKAVKAPSSALASPSSTAPPHFPHASLYYGNGTRDDRHHIIMHMLDQRVLDIQFDKDGNSNVEVTGLKTVELDSLWIVDTGESKESTPSEWKLLLKESFGAGAGAEAAAVPPPIGAAATGEKEATTLRPTADGNGKAVEPTASSPPSPTSPTSETNGSASKNGQ
jgi:hypothetical protein